MDAAPLNSTLRGLPSTTCQVGGEQQERSSAPGGIRREELG